MSNSKKLISIVSPAYNEQDNIPLMIQAVEKTMRTLADCYDYEYIIVDDGSQDETWRAVAEQSRKNSKVKGLRLTRNFGQQIALTTGIDQARGAALIYCDSDLQHPPSLFPKMIKKWEQGAKVVHTRRVRTQNGPLLKKIFSKLFYRLVNFLSDTPVKEGMADFKLLDREVYLKFKRMRERNRFLRGMVPWLGYRSVVVEYEAEKRVAGLPGYDFRRNLSFAKTGILSMSVKPLKYVGYLGVALTLVSLLGLVAAVFLMFTKNDFRYISPTVLLMIFNTLLIGIVLTCLGVVALYISYLHQEIIKRPLYIVSETVNIE